MTDQKLKLNLNFYTLYTSSSLLFVVFYRLIIFNINNGGFFTGGWMVEVVIFIF